MEEAVLKSVTAGFPPAGGDDARAKAGTIRHIDWSRVKETYVRCCFLLGIMFLLGFMAWRPGFLRLTALLSLNRPSHGESLTLRLEDDFQPPPPLPIRLLPPAEWRQRPAIAAGAVPARPASRETALAAGKASAPSWSRLFMNPWTWQNDAARTRSRKRNGDALQPGQQPATSFRAGNVAFWPDTTPGEAHPTPAADTNAAATAAPANEKPAGFSLVALPPLASDLPPFPSLVPLAGEKNEDKRDTLAALALPELPGDAPGQEKPAAARQTLEPKRLELPAPLEKRDIPASHADTPASPGPRSETKTAPDRENPERGEGIAAKAATEKPESVDWANREITRAIPGAYVTIYPKLKFVGLCVPGQGYVRKYNQVGTPEDLVQPKVSAQDGKTPYGMYYIAEKQTGADGGGVLALSWPSPDDAKRIGLPPGVRAEIQAAWDRKSLPPQNTGAGGDVSLTGSKNPAEFTRGGFVLLETQMQELVTALPPGAWVFVQP